VRGFLTAVLVPLALMGCRSVVPEILPPAEIPVQIRTLPSYVRFGVTGVAFWKGRLYAGTNIGLLEIQGDRASALYQWHSKDNVVEEPWVDRGGDALWFWDFHTLDFRRWDERGWSRTGLPPKEGYYSRGNILGGFRGYSDAGGFWLEGAGCVWKWDRQAHKWEEEILPGGGIRGLAAAGDGLYALLLSPQKYSVRELGDLDLHVRDGAQWKRIATAPRGELIAKVVGLATGGYVLSRKGNLTRFDRHGFATVEQPGVCEAITATSEGYLLGSFLGKGLWERRGDQWKLRCPYPYDSNEGKHWAFIAEENGRIALATAEDSEIVDWTKGTRAWTGTSAIWVLKGDVLERVKLE
jgi:hypothetical protein